MQISSDAPQRRGTPAPHEGFWVGVLLVLGRVVWSLSGRYQTMRTDPNAVPWVVTLRGALTGGGRQGRRTKPVCVPSLPRASTIRITHPATLAGQLPCAALSMQPHA